MHGREGAGVTRAGFRERFATPVLIVFCVMTLSWGVYNLSWRLESATLHRLLAGVSGTFLFLSVACGTLFVYSVAWLRGASLGERVLASLINPLLWATKECFRLCISFSLLESLYYYLNPLNIWLAFGVAAEMALAEMLCRQRSRRLGSTLRVLHPAAVSVFVVSLSLVVGLYAWGEGENVYTLFLEGYRALFGPGVGVKVPLQP